MPGAIYRAIAGLLVLAAPLGAAPLATDAWRLRQPFVVPQSGPVKLELQAATLDAARPDLADLRLVDPAGQEVAFAREQTRREQPVIMAPRRMSSTVEDNAMVFALETGTDVPIIALQIDAGSQRFLTRALVESSDDGIAWRTLGRNLPVYDRGGPLRALELPIPPGTYPHLRVSFDRLGGTHLALVSIKLVTRRAPVDLTEPVSIRIAAREESAGETRLTLALPGANLFLADLEILTPEPVFDRPARLTRQEVADEAIHEIPLGQGVLTRTGPFASPATNPVILRLETQVAGRTMILSIDNGDSPPLAITGVTARRRPVWLTFEAPAPGRYTLYVGNAGASTPRYDVAALIATLANALPLALSPGPLEHNPDYRSGEPLPELSPLGAPLDVGPWEFRKPVRSITAGAQQLELDPEILARSRPDLGDLRLVSDGRQVPFVVERTSLCRALAVSVAATPDPKRPSRSRWRLTMPLARLPLVRLSAMVATPLFRRDMQLGEDVEDDRGYVSHRILGWTTWSRTPGINRNAWTVPFNQPPLTDTLWLETDNGDNPPIAPGEVRVLYGVTRLLFKADDQTPVFLYYGNAQAAPPSYDLRLVAAQMLAADKSPCTLGTEERLKGGSFAQTLITAGRGGILFWSMLVLVVIVLLVVIARLLPNAPSAGGPGQAPPSGGAPAGPASESAVRSPEP